MNDLSKPTREERKRFRRRFGSMSMRVRYAMARYRSGITVTELSQTFSCTPQLIHHWERTNDPRLARHWRSFGFTGV